jgi:hypothetical protein
MLVADATLKDFWKLLRRRLQSIKNQRPSASLTLSIMFALPPMVSNQLFNSPISVVADPLLKVTGQIILRFLRRWCDSALDGLVYGIANLCQYSLRVITQLFVEDDCQR